MKTGTSVDVYVKVKDSDGIHLACPLRVLEDLNNASDDNWDQCFEADIVRRYAGRVTIIDPT